MAKVTCTVCNGNGWLVNQDCVTDNEDSPDHYECYFCNGDGYIEED